MVAYLIVHRREITDPETLKLYARGVDRTIAKFGGKVLVRADSFEVLEGSWHPGLKHADALPERITIIEFPNLARLHAWYESVDYARLKSIRQRSSSSDVVAVEGERAVELPAGRSWSRDLVAFGTGAAVMLLASRMAPQLADQIVDSLRGAADGPARGAHSVSSQTFDAVRPDRGDGATVAGEEGGAAVPA